MIQAPATNLPPFPTVPETRTHVCCGSVFGLAWTWVRIHGRWVLMQQLTVDL